VQQHEHLANLEHGQDCEEQRARLLAGGRGRGHHGLHIDRGVEVDRDSREHLRVPATVRVGLLQPLLARAPLLLGLPALRGQTLDGLQALAQSGRLGREPSRGSME
jgi:hypothetical protein